MLGPATRSARATPPAQRLRTAPSWPSAAYRSPRSYPPYRVVSDSAGWWHVLHDHRGNDTSHEKASCSQYLHASIPPLRSDRQRTGDQPVRSWICVETRYTHTDHPLADCDLLTDRSDLFALSKTGEYLNISRAGQLEMKAQLASVHEAGRQRSRRASRQTPASSIRTTNPSWRRK